MISGLVGALIGLLAIVQPTNALAHEGHEERTLFANVQMRSATELNITVSLDNGTVAPGLNVFVLDQAAGQHDPHRIRAPEQGRGTYVIHLSSAPDPQRPVFIETTLDGARYRSSIFLTPDLIDRRIPFRDVTPTAVDVRPYYFIGASACFMLAVLIVLRGRIKARMLRRSAQAKYGI